MDDDDDEDRLPDEQELTGDLFDHYLGLAEELLGQADRQWEAIRRYRLLGALVVGLTVLLTMITVTVGPVGVGTALAEVLVGGVVAVAAVVLIGRWLVAPRRRQAVRDEEAMVEAITVLRDLQPHLAEQESWGYVRVRMIGLRMSRFPIGPRRG